MVRGPIAGQPCGELIGSFNQPRIARLGGEQDNLTDRNDAPIMLGSPAQNVANFVGETKVLAIHHALARSTLDRSSTHTGVCHGNIHQAVRQPLGVCLPLLDRIVIHGYLSALSRPEQVVHFFHQVLGIPVVARKS